MSVFLGVLSILFSILALLFLVGFFLALFGSKAILTEKTIKKQALLATAFLFILFGALAGATHPQAEPQQKEQANPVVTAKVRTPTSLPTNTPTLTKKSTLTPSSVIDGMGVSFDQMTFGLGLNMQPVDGQPNTYLGIFADKVGSSLRVIGNKQNISKAWFNINGLQEAQSNPTIQLELSTALPEFVSNAFPKTPTAKQWVANTINAITTNDTQEYQEQSTVIENKKVIVKVNKQIGFLEVDIEKN